MNQWTVIRPMEAARYGSGQPRVSSAFRSTMRYQHQDTLRTILQALGVSGLPNAAGTANTLGDMLE